VLNLIQKFLFFIWLCIYHIAIEYEPDIIYNSCIVIIQSFFIILAICFILFYLSLLKFLDISRNLFLFSLIIFVNLRTLVFESSYNSVNLFNYRSCYIFQLLRASYYLVMVNLTSFIPIRMNHPVDIIICVLNASIL
jgi:hypothetical protein